MGCDQRIGLLALGSLKLILFDLLSLGLFVYKLVIRFELYRRKTLYPVIIMSVTILLLISDIAYSIVLLCGSHKRNRTLLRVFFWYSIVGFILTVLQTSHSLFSHYSMVSYYGSWHMILRSYDFYSTILFYGLLNLVLQLCIMILVRREIKKLDTTKRSDGVELQKV